MAPTPEQFFESCCAVMASDAERIGKPYAKVAYDEEEKKWKLTLVVRVRGERHEIIRSMDNQDCAMKAADAVEMMQTRGKPRKLAFHVSTYSHIQEGLLCLKQKIVVDALVKSASTVHGEKDNNQGAEGGAAASEAVATGQAGAMRALEDVVRAVERPDTEGHTPALGEDDEAWTLDDMDVDLECSDCGENLRTPQSAGGRLSLRGLEGTGATMKQPDTETRKFVHLAADGTTPVRDDDDYDGQHGDTFESPDTVKAGRSLRADTEVVTRSMEEMQLAASGASTRQPATPPAGVSRVFATDSPGGGVPHPGIAKYRAEEERRAGLTVEQHDAELAEKSPFSLITYAPPCIREPNPESSESPY